MPSEAWRQHPRPIPAIGFGQPDGLQRQQGRELAGRQQLFAELEGEAAGAAEQGVEHEGAAEVVVEGVLGGEADPGQDLLGVAGDGAGAAAREDVCEWGEEPLGCCL